jgi:hydroxypyruvate reductase
LVITRYGYARACKGIEIVEAAHPVPDGNGAEATQRMLALLQGLGPDDFVLALISGGGSALLTAPAGNISQGEKQRINAALLASGAPISQMNTVRKHLSRVKGGQLAVAAFPAKMLSLMISDVPGDAPASIASGPTVGDNSTPEGALKILRQYGIEGPPTIAAVLSAETRVLKPETPALSKVENKVIAAPRQSLEAAAKLGQVKGFDVRILDDALEGEARDAGRAHACLALELQSKMAVTAKPVLLLSGGECTVTRRGSGCGGPNAEFALAAAIVLNGAVGIYAICCDTDGVDGAAEVAGAFISPQTIEKAKAAELDIQEYLVTNDSHTFFGNIGDQVITGPTLTNVNDFRAILVNPPTPELG